MTMYLKYLKYLLIHKYYVALECFHLGLYWHALTHDLSKFFLHEFPASAQYYFGTKTIACQEKYRAAWYNHKKRNKHHWQYWIDTSGQPIDIPTRYCKQIVADWRGMGHMGYRTANEYFYDEQRVMILTASTKSKIRRIIHEDWYK